ncbi:endonuclease, partial [bacterium]|nr:endonuclease [bacterium]
MKFILFLIFSLLIIQIAHAFNPITVEEYYESVVGLEDESLRDALHNLIKDHVMYPYFSDSTVATRDIMIESDIDLTNPENIILFYSGRIQDKDFQDHGDNFDYMNEYGIFHENSWNREHVWAKSHGFPDMADTAYTDVHHLRPADRSVNGARGNRDFDWGGFELEEVDECYYDYDSWEPPDRVKGDVARMLFYMAVRYEGDGKTYD